MEEIPFDENQHAVGVLQEMNDFRAAKRQRLCDFLIKVEEKEIHVHKNVVEANSNYFRAMLSHDTLENQTGCVEFKDMDAECVATCVDFMYNRKISVSSEKWQELMKVADLLQLHKLCDYLSAFIGSKLNAKSFYRSRGVAKTFCRTDLEQKCDKFAVENFEAVARFDEFVNLPQDYITFLLESKENTAPEIEKVQAMLRWVKSCSDRDKALFEMLQRIELGKVPEGCCRYWLENEPLIRGSLDCYRLLSSSVMDSLGVVVENPCDSIVLFDNKSKHLQRFIPARDTWTQMQEMPSGLTQKNFNAVAFKEFIFVFMGNKAVHRLKYTSEEATWERMCETIGDHGSAAPAVCDDDNVYVVGGCYNWPSKSIEKYDVVKNRWSVLTEENFNSNFACVCVQHKIYCIGGKNVDRDVNDTVVVFDMISNRWNALAPLLNARSYAAAAAFLGNIYVMGGQDDKTRIDTVECYDPESNCWSFMPKLLLGRTGFKAYEICHTLFAVGSYMQKQHAKIIEKFDIAEKKWKKVVVPRNMKLDILCSVAAKL